MTETTDLAAEVERLRQLVDPPRPLPVCWVCGHGTRDALTDVFASGKPLCRPCATSNPSTGPVARGAATLYVFLAAEDRPALAECHHDLVADVIESILARLDLDEVQEALVPDVVPAVLRAVGAGEPLPPVVRSVPGKPTLRGHYAGLADAAVVDALASAGLNLDDPRVRWARGAATAKAKGERPPSPPRLAIGELEAAAPAVADLVAEAAEAVAGDTEADAEDTDEDGAVLVGTVLPPAPPPSPLVAPSVDRYGARPAFVSPQSPGLRDGWGGSKVIRLSVQLPLHVRTVHLKT